ncbi:AraC family transcriptional regulator [Cryobacterium algoricola]|uniref:AraC family transcriptional regulator n=2 Tax=Cryobacterium TaxID=69578 RepID=A0AA41QTW1_9MICO|nr:MULTISPECIES: AraC family transcriptional regulator [Cryobacterium]MCI4656908.1 AraC family transcriptional regulator [Cryobacterium zhongshanensis]TFB84275.1 AraC family transcriptional regulator [Cryobacterium algoricola]
MKLVEGFRNERMCVVPRPLVDEILARPVTRRLVVTDAGLFPEARNHERFRPSGSPETILLACTAGSGWVELGGVRTGVGSGSVVLIPGGVPHRYASSDSNPWTIWWCHLRGTDAAELVEATGATVERPVLPMHNIERCVALIDEIITALERDLLPARMIGASGIAWQLLTRIALDRALPERGDPLQRAMAYLSERLDSAVKVSELASMVGVSASHLGAMFRTATGGGVLAHHTALRMSRARQLLDTSSLGIAQIAHAVGYQDALYFSRQFHRTHGVSPSEYRAHRKG